MFENLRMVDSVQNNSPVCCNTPTSETFKLSLKYLPIFAERKQERYLKHICDSYITHTFCTY